MSLHVKAERRPPPRAETFRDKTRESLEEGESLFSLNELVVLAFFFSTLYQHKHTALLIIGLNVFFPPLTHPKKVFFFPPAMLAAKRQDGGLFKSPPYPGYPFIMIPDLTSPYLSNGSLSPTARTVSALFFSFVFFVAFFLSFLNLNFHFPVHTSETHLIALKWKSEQKADLQGGESYLRNLDSKV